MSWSWLRPEMLVIYGVLVLACLLGYLVHRARVKYLVEEIVHDILEASQSQLQIGIAIVRPGGQATDFETHLVAALRNQGRGVVTLPRTLPKTIARGAVCSEDIFTSHQLHLILTGVQIQVADSGNMQVDYRIVMRGTRGRIAVGEQTDWFVRGGERPTAERLAKTIVSKLVGNELVVDVGCLEVYPFPDKGRLPDPTEVVQ